MITSNSDLLLHFSLRKIAHLHNYTDNIALVAAFHSMIQVQSDEDQIIQRFLVPMCLSIEP